jgi:hypothetical protein
MNEETRIQTAIRNALSAGPTRAWRNNIAKIKVRGRWMDFGIPGKGGSDLIGLHSMTIEPHHVGRKVAVFLAVEVKTETGSPTSAQRRFIEFVESAGGIAGIARSPGDALSLIENYES